MASRRLNNSLLTYLFACILMFAGVQSSASASDEGNLQQLVADNLSVDYLKQIESTQSNLDYNLGILIEREFILQEPLTVNYTSLSGYLDNMRSRSISEIWKANNYAFLSKPAQERTGEGLIPDIQVPIPGLGKVFGTGAQLKVNGYQKITAGNEITKYNTTGQAYDANKITNDNNIKIKQEQKINLEGVIGERVHVLIDYNSEADIDKKSKVRLKYEGKEDEVLKSLEAGDTEFSVTGSNLVGGLTTVHQGLFGIKGVVDLGGFELAAIASKDEGQSESKTIEGSNETDSFSWYDKDYFRHKVFEIFPWGLHGDTIDVIKVFTSTSSTNSSKFHNLINRSWYDFAGKDTFPYNGMVKLESKLEIQDYLLVDGTTGKIVFTYPVNDDAVMGVAYKTKKGYYYPSRYDFEYEDTLMLVKPSNCQPPDSVNGYCWNYERRNYYNLKNTGIDINSINIRLQKRVGSDWVEKDPISGLSYRQILGLSDSSEDRLYDNYINQEDGYFFFPDTMPFNSSLLEDKNPEIYTSNKLEQVTAKYRLIITCKKNTSIYYLNPPGRLMENSIKVYLNGAEVSSSEYSVDYDMATVTFSDKIKAEIQKSNSKLKIDYQYSPLSALGSKTLIGLRGTYPLGEKGTLGGTWLYRSEQMPDEKPRLGEEPRRIIVAGLDLNYDASPEYFTKMVDALPLVESEALSKFSFNGEIATNFPNPNTKGQVYIDDMDGSKVSDEFNLTRTAWSRSSVPAGQNDTDLARTFYWYNPETQVKLEEINEDITEQTTETIRTLALRYKPDSNQVDRAWAGMTQLLSKSGLDLSESKIFNLWVKGTSGIIHIDIGKDISEDQVWRYGRDRSKIHLSNGIIDAESLDISGEPVRTNNNDWGMDGVQGNDSSSVPGDDGNDDWSSSDMTKINGTENNGYYDTEDLKLSGLAPGSQCQTNDNYYTFRFDLSKNSPNSHNWHQLSALLDTAKLVGARLGWNNIQYARIWLDSCPAGSEYQIALAEVSGNRWQSQGIISQDSLEKPVFDYESFSIKVKNNRDDRDYTMPPNTEQKDESGNIEFEQSLVFAVKDLRSKHYASAKKNLRDSEGNFSGYKTLKMWVHSNDSTRYMKRSVAVRLIGNDDKNYYQFKMPLTSQWQELSAELEKFSSLKKLPFPSDTTDKTRTDGNYSIVGSPSLLNLSGVAICVFNDDSTIAGDYTDDTRKFNDEVWFDELRLDDVRRDRGTAVRTSGTFTFADLLTLTAGFEKTGGHWYTMDGQGSGKNSNAYSVGGKLFANKFFPAGLGLSLPIGFGYTLSRRYNEYGDDDIRLTEEESRAQREMTLNRNIDLSLSKSISDWWLTRYTVDRMSYGLQWSKTFNDSRTNADSTTSLGMQVGYRLSGLNIKPLKVWPNMQVNYFPNDLYLGWNGSQTRAWKWEKISNVISTNGTESKRNGSGSISWKLLNSLDYSFNTNRNLRDTLWQGNWARRLKLGSETGRTQKISYSTTLAWIKVLKPSLSFNTLYRESHGVARNPKLVNDSIHVLSVDNSNSMQMGSSLEVGKWLAKITGLRDKARDDSAEVGSPRWAVIKLDKLFNKFGGVQASFSRDLSNQAGNLLEKRPDIMYQLGLRQRVDGIPRLSSTDVDRNSVRNTYSLSTSLELARLSITLAMRRTDDTTSVGEAKYFNRSVTWPEARFTLIGLEKLPFWKKAMSSASISSFYSRGVDRKWELKKGPLSTISKNSFTPLINLSGRWKKNVISNLNIDYTNSKTKYETGQAKDIYNQYFKANGTVSYSFSAPKGFKLNFWKLGKKRIKFNSDLSVNAQLNYSIRGDRNQIPASDMTAFWDLFTVKTDALPADPKNVKNLNFTSLSQDYGITTGLGYNFTRSIKGSASFEYNKVKDKISSSNDNSRMKFEATVDILF